jgi:hypothetical protein
MMFRALATIFTVAACAATASAQPLPLQDRQLDSIAAGTAEPSAFVPALATGVRLSGGVFLFHLSGSDVTNTSTVMLNIDPVACNTCYLNIMRESFTVQAQFGPPAAP